MTYRKTLENTLHEWQPWIDIVDEGGNGVKWALEDTPKKYRKLVALILSCAKWHPMRDHVGGTLAEDCGLCVNFFDSYCWDDDITKGFRCRKCPYFKFLRGTNCYNQTLWRVWEDLSRQGQPRLKSQAAKPIFQQLMSMYVAERARVLK